MKPSRTNGNLSRRGLFPRLSFLDDFFSEDWPSFDLGADFEKEWMPAANIVEKEKAFEVELSVPGYENKDIKVEVDENNVLHINGEHKEEKGEDKDNYTRKEFSYGSFNRSFQLPESVNEDNITAKCKNGVLQLKIAKKELPPAGKKTKQIDIA